jgi:yecA family protein
MPQHALFDYDDWTNKLDQNAMMASAAEVHGLIAGMLSAGMSKDASLMLPVLHDFLNDGQAVNSELKAAIVQLIEETARQIADEELSFALLLPNDDEAMPERLEALVEWAQSFLVGFAIQQHDLSVFSADVREAIEQLTEVTRIDVYTQDDSSEAENEESYFLVLEHVRVLVMTCFNEVGEKFASEKAPNATLH